MISFTSDYNNGVHPKILEQLSLTNALTAEGYGEDDFCQAARQAIRKATGLPQAEVFFAVGGTQTNALVISVLLLTYEGVVCASTGHIAVHEAGAIEATGHKVLTLPGTDGKLEAEQVERFLTTFDNDPAHEHCVAPGMVYVTFPTEQGTLYTRSELEALHRVCQKHHLPLYVDGARLGYGLASTASDLTLPLLAQCCDVFYIGGTKQGAMFGEAIVFGQMPAPRGFFSHIKRQGALLAKGRFLGIQFLTLFTDDLYLSLSRHALTMAERVRCAFVKAGYTLAFASSTNQQFVLLSAEEQAAMAQHFAFEQWEVLPDGQIVVRFCTSWATTEEQITALENYLQLHPKT